MTTKQTTEVEGLPEGWEIEKLTFNEIDGLKPVWRKKTQPRSIVVLEETMEDNLQNGIENSWCNQHFRNGLILFQQPKIWREVKENDLSLPNDEPKLSLSVKECSTLLANGFGVCNVWEKIREFIKDK